MSKQIWFADRHHSQLAHSIRLMAERIGATVLFPIGMDWYKYGFFHVAKPYGDNPATIKQFLSLDQAFVPEDGSPPLNRLDDIFSDLDKDYITIEDKAHGDTLKAVTLDQFKSMKVDIIIASIPAHWYVYKDLRDTYQPKASVVAHAGNMFNELPEAITNGTVEALLASIKPFDMDTGIPTLFYHQEFPQEPFLPPYYDSLPEVNSFVHLHPARELFDWYKYELLEWQWSAYGGSCPDGWLSTISEINQKMRDSLYVWHVKPMGDGYGHVWYSAFANGRPVITNFSDYADKLGAELFEHGVTGIDLERGSFKDNVKLLTNLTDPDTHIQMCHAARERFNECVNFAKEGKEIKKFFDALSRQT